MRVAAERSAHLQAALSKARDSALAVALEGDQP
jgi:hypothetical protein